MRKSILLILPALDILRCSPTQVQALIVPDQLIQLQGNTKANWMAGNEEGIFCWNSPIYIWICFITTDLDFIFEEFNFELLCQMHTSLFQNTIFMIPLSKLQNIFQLLTVHNATYSWHATLLAFQFMMFYNFEISPNSCRTCAPQRRGRCWEHQWGHRSFQNPFQPLSWIGVKVDVIVAIIKIAIIITASIPITVITIGWSILIIITLGLITCNNQCHCQLHSWEWVSEWCRGRRTGQSSSPAGCSSGPGCPDLWLESI